VGIYSYDIHGELAFMESFNLFPTGPEYLEMNRETINNAIGKRIRAHRLNLKWSSTSLARQLKISFQQLTRYERGITHINMTILHELSKVFNVNMEYFFEGILTKETKMKEKKPFKIFFMGLDPEDEFSLKKFIEDIDKSIQVCMVNFDTKEMLHNADLIFIDMEYQRNGKSLNLLRNIKKNVSYLCIPVIVLTAPTSFEDGFPQRYFTYCNGIIKSSGEEDFKKKLHMAITYWKDINWNY
jgi:transcriptional regulator with XRE-family HTH domain